MNDIIASRELQFVEIEAAAPQIVLIEIGRPEPAHDGRDWGAPYRLTGPHCDAKVRYGYGTDSLDALMCVLRLLRIHVDVLVSGGGKLTLHGSDDIGVLAAGV
jgi:hypothetical protein